MSQKPAYTTAEVIAVGMAMRARGVEPERPTLWTELGRRGLSSTPWNTWLEHRDSQLPARTSTDIDGTVHSPEMTSAIENQNRALATIIACARTEAETPLLQRIEVLEKALARETAERRNLDRLVDDLEVELAACDAQLTAARSGTPKSRLIMPWQ